jgi:hypothetical protein
MLNLKPPIDINRGELKGVIFFPGKKRGPGGGAPVAFQSLGQEDQLI